MEQLHDNLAALTVSLSAEQVAALDRASALEPAFFDPEPTTSLKRAVFGGASVDGWR